MSELPDWLRGVLLLGQDGAYYRPVGVDEQGRLTVVAVGEDDVGALHALRVDSQGQIIMVPRGANGNYLAVDPNGYLYTILKGEYEGQLRTVKLDSEGRISAFIIDSTDAWGQMLAIGNAELAVRLGSPVAYDRRGSVLWWDDFRYGLSRWYKLSGGAGAKVEIVPTPSCSGGYSVHYQTPAGGGYAAILASTPLFMAGVFGLGALAAFPSSNAIITLRINAYTGSKRINAALRYELPGGNVKVYNAQGSWQSVESGVILVTGLGKWYGFKIVVDIGSVKYRRALILGREYDLGTIAPYSESHTGAPCVEVAILLEPYDASAGSDMYTDSIILTAAEP